MLWQGPAASGLTNSIYAADMESTEGMSACLSRQSTKNIMCLKVGSVPSWEGPSAQVFWASNSAVEPEAPLLPFIVTLTRTNVTEQRVASSPLGQLMESKLMPRGSKWNGKRIHSPRHYVCRIWAKPDLARAMFNKAFQYVLVLKCSAASGLNGRGCVAGGKTVRTSGTWKERREWNEVVSN